MKTNDKNINVILIVVMSLALNGCATQSERLVPGIFLEEPTRDGLPQGVILRKISDAGLSVTKDAEGFIREKYDDPAGYCTIGYGHLLQRNRCNGKEPGELESCEVSKRGEFRSAIYELRGEQILRCDMARAEVAVTRLARSDLTDGEFAALADFTFNVGARKFERSTLLRVVNDGNYQQVAKEFRRWVLADGKKLRGLQERREREIKLFFNGVARGGQPEETELIDIRIGEPM